MVYSFQALLVVLAGSALTVGAINMKDNLEKSIDDVRVALRERGPSSITGGQVHALIREVAPGIDVRQVVDIPSPKPGALTEFIDQYLGEVLSQIGMHGGDKLYGINGYRGGYESSDNLAAVWKSFVSTQSRFSVVIEKSTSRLRSIPTELVDSEYLKVPKVTLDEHDKVREDFHLEFESEIKSCFQSPPSPSDEFHSWILEIKTKPGLYHKWGLFRKDRLLSLFAARLKELGVEDDLIPSLVKGMGRSQKTNVEKSEKQKAIPSGSVDYSISTLPSVSNNGQKAIARLAQGAINEMSEEQVRALHFPLGAIFDALRKS